MKHEVFLDKLIDDLLGHRQKPLVRVMRWIFGDVDFLVREAMNLKLQQEIRDGILRIADAFEAMKKKFEPPF